MQPHRDPLVLPTSLRGNDRDPRFSPGKPIIEPTGDFAQKRFWAKKEFPFPWPNPVTLALGCWLVGWARQR